MTSQKSTSTPRFIEEALAQPDEHDQPNGHELAQAHQLLDPGTLGDDDPGLNALLQASATPGHRYDPFVTRLSKMFGLSEEQVQRLLANPAWKNSPLPGIKYIDVPDGKGHDPELSSSLVWLAPGTKYPRHRHTNPETILVLEGGYTDASGEHFGAGDVQRMAPGTEHFFVTDKHGPCVAATVSDRKLHFSSWFLRSLAKIFGN